MYGRFGTRVTLLGRNSRLAPGEDPDLAELLAEYLREEDIEVYTNAPVTSVRKEGQKSLATAVVDGEEKEFRAEVVLLAAGRVGNTDRLDLEAAGVATLAKGFVQVDGQLTTSQPNIFAIGDVKGGWMFTHVATYDGPVAALNAVKGAGRSVDYRFHILAPHGDDLLHEVVAAMHDHGGIKRIGKSIHAHPTLGEMVKAAAKAAN